MRTAVVIPTLNAVKRGIWGQVLDAVSRQSIPLERKIIIDSDSDDATCAVAESCGWECWKIKRENFNHGSTRDLAVRKLAENGIDTVVFLSQDVILTTQDVLTRLTGFLWSNPISGCFGRQCSTHIRTLDAWQRQWYYPERSAVRTLKDIPHDHLMTCFFSDAFSAWKTADVIHCGGFPETDFGEDMLLAAKVQNCGGGIGYCAEAVALHEHSCTLWSLFSRGMQVGAFHRNHPELRRQFGKLLPRPLVSIPWKLLLPFGVKFSGYLCGRIGGKGIPLALFLLMWLLLFPAIWSFDFPQRDVAARYAPMAEAFARGEWQFAFHPRVTPLLPVTSGILAFLLSCNGYLACQLDASLLLTVALFPFYFGCKKIYGEKTAFFAGILFALCPPFLRLGYYGLRETGSILGVVLLFYATTVFYRQSHIRKGFLWFAVAEAILLLSRGDIALFAVIAGAMLVIWDIFRNRIPWRSILTGVAVFAMIVPQLCYNYRAIGYPVPEVRHAVVWKKLCRKTPLLKHFENPHPYIPLDIGGGDDDE